MRHLFFLLLLGMGVGFFACGSDSSSTESNAENEADGNVTIETEDGTVNVDAKNLQEAMNQVTEAMGGDSDVEVMNFRALKAILPERLLGMDRTEHTGETAGAFGMKFSTAEAEYEAGDRSLEVTIMDAAQMGVAQMGAAAWTQVELDKESDEGYERTVTIQGQRGYEKYDNRDKSGELALFYEGRYVISLKGRNIEMDDLRDALDDLDLRDLE